MFFADDPNNYRPISVLSTISKLFEQVVCSQFDHHIYSILAWYTGFCDLQHQMPFGNLKIIYQ
jgi:hypothetical protein